MSTFKSSIKIPPYPKQSESFNHRLGGFFRECWQKLKVRGLDPIEHERFSKQWESVQSRFVDSTKGAVAEPDDLESSLMKTRGYPVSDFEQRAADISVDHPRVRLGKAFTDERSSLEQQWDRGDSVSTEDLRVTLRHYRSFFDRLLKL